jgi:AGCS family alanine or glycine:cation symporter
LLWVILRSAFRGHAPIGGFVGSTLLVAIQQGVAQGVYSSDIAVGFDSVLHSESRATDPRRQACVTIMASLTDTLMCTCSFVVVLLSGLWQEGAALSSSDCILKAFETHFKWGPHFLSIIIFLAGLTTIQAYFVVGLKSASYLNSKWGKPIYFVVGILNLWIFSHCQQSHVLTLMRLASGLLIWVNLMCLFRLRNQVYYDLDGVFKKTEKGSDGA